jgi:phospholipid/cholesterol/gamma-HCH transport system substrate-binding protein
MVHSFVEAFIGAVVLCIALIFLIFAYRTSGTGPVANGYLLKARFERVDGVSIGTAVKIGGVKVGTVRTITLDPKTFQAELEFGIEQQYQLPKDSAAQISSEGLLGGKFVSLVPGADEAILNSGERILFTQSSVNIESLIGKFMVGGNSATNNTNNVKTESAPSLMVPSLRVHPPTP